MTQAFCAAALLPEGAVPMFRSARLLPIGGDVFPHPAKGVSKRTSVRSVSQKSACIDEIHERPPPPSCSRGPKMSSMPSSKNNWHMIFVTRIADVPVIRQRAPTRACRAKNSEHGTQTKEQTVTDHQAASKSEGKAEAKKCALSSLAQHPRSSHATQAA